MTSLDIFNDILARMEQLEHRYPHRPTPYSLKDCVDLRREIATLSSKLFSQWGSEGDRLAKLDDEAQLRQLREEARRILALMDSLELSLTKPISCCTDKELFREFIKRLGARAQQISAPADDDPWNDVAVVEGFIEGNFELQVGFCEDGSLKRFETY